MNSVTFGYTNQAYPTLDYHVLTVNYYDDYGYPNVNNTISGAVNPLYNGDISETIWRTNSDNLKRAYGFVYDAMDRLRNSYYQKPSDATPNTGSYNENVRYDKNGNIAYLDRTGDYDDAVYSLLIDNLTYTYESANSNRLIKVSDTGSATVGFVDGANSANEYTYDDFGNIKRDYNKGISTDILYNHLNQPTSIPIALGTISYLYNAKGEKVKKIVIQGSPAVTTTTDYFDGYQYKNDKLQFFPTSEGYVDVTFIGTTPHYNYVFNYNDQLGNNRITYGTNSTGYVNILQENNYYPFGMKHNNYNMDQATYIETDNGTDIGPCTPCDKYKYKYNGKELQDELGLNLYSYGARNYDPALGRWITIDSSSEKYKQWSPYNYCFNNPIHFEDPNGMDPEWHRDLGGVLVADAGDTAETLAAYMGSSLLEARAQFNHNYYHYETEMNGGEAFYRSERAVNSGAYGPSYGKDDLKISLAIAGAVTLPVAATGGLLAAGGSYLLTEATAAISGMSWGSATYGMASDALSQGIANGGDLSKINVVQTLASAVPGIGSTMVGGTFKLSAGDVMQGNFTPSAPTSFEQAGLQMAED